MKNMWISWVQIRDKGQSWQNTNINYLREELKEKPYGSLINRGTVNVKYFDDKEELEFSYQLVSK